MVANFGQDSSFAGNETAQGNTDGNGIGDFYYSPPSGYLALCTSNLPEPTISPNADTQADDYFNTVLYTGNSSTQSITGVGFQPDFVWLKARSSSGYDHVLQDSVRGSTKQIYSNSTSAEVDDTDAVTSFDSSGFTTGADVTTNNSGVNYASWNWKAGGTAVSNTDGSITSSVSANTDAGFSIVGFTGNGGTNVSVGHGLSEAPQVVIIKDRDASNNWFFNHTLVDGTNDGMYLNLTDANGTFSGSVPTSSVFYVDGGRNASGNAQIAYCFHNVEGYSKFGSYTGNGSTDGTFVYTGFRPAWLMVRDIGVADWDIQDTTRSPINPSKERIWANLSSAETYSTYDIDFLSNGFKLRSTNPDTNSSGDTKIYMCFAENPFKYSLGR
jgi:hypothetical protein